MKITDFILNGVAQGSVAAKLMASDFNTNILRPWVGDDGRTYMSIWNSSKKEFEARPVMNATATLRKDDWIQLDEAILKAAKPRLRAVGDLRAAGLTYTIPNGMGKTVLQTENVGDINDAIISMDPVRAGVDDRPIFDITNLPLPVIHKDFHFSARQLQTSRSGNSPLDTTMGELAGRKVAEQAEQLLLGRTGRYNYGGGVIFGYTNYTGRMTQLLSNPVTHAGWDGNHLLTEVLAMRTSSQAAFHYGPWVLYNSPNWDAYLDEDFKLYSDVTLRERIAKIEGISKVATLDYLTGFDMLLIQMTSDVIREIIGMDITTVQWETHGGMLQHFKVLCILVPQLRTDQNGRTGIVHGAA